MSLRTGYGFVRYETHDEAAFAVQAMNGVMYNNRPLQVSFKKDNKNITNNTLESSSIYFQPLPQPTNYSSPPLPLPPPFTTAVSNAKGKSKFMRNNNHQALFFHAHQALNPNMFTII